MCFGRAVSRFPPSHSGSTSAASTLLPYDLVKSLGPYTFTTHATLLDCVGLPPSPSNSFTPPDTARNCARCPPAEPPVTPMRSGSILYFVAFARVHRIAALQS